MSDFSRQYCISTSHPSLAGHFPNHPVVPGVVILDYARNQLVKWLPQCRVIAISQVKFIKPLHPGQNFIIRLIHSSVGSIKFECSSNHDKLVVGTFIVETKNE